MLTKRTPTTIGGTKKAAPVAKKTPVRTNRSTPKPKVAAKVTAKPAARKPTVAKKTEVPKNINKNPFAFSFGKKPASVKAQPVEVKDPERYRTYYGVEWDM